MGLNLGPMKDLKGVTANHLDHSEKALLIFWATWCPSCKTKLVNVVPELSKRKDLTVVVVNTDEDPQRAQDFLDGQKLEFRNWADADSSLRKSLGVKAVPHWVTVEKKAGQWTVREEGTELDVARVLSSLSLN